MKKKIHMVLAFRYKDTWYLVCACASKPCHLKYTYAPFAKTMMVRYAHAQIIM